MRVNLSLAAAIALSAFSIGQCAHAEDVAREAYVLTDLGSLPGGEGAEAHSINDSGQVVGCAYLKGDDFEKNKRHNALHACLWQKGTIHDLGTVPGDDKSVALGVNQKGQIAGWSGSRSERFGTHGFLWQNGKLTALDGFVSGKLVIPWRINNEGHVVGSAETGVGDQTHAVLWQGTKPIDLGTLPRFNDWSYNACGINDKGQIVGTARLSLNWCSFSWQNGKMSPLEALPGSKDTIAAATSSAAGLIVGCAYFPAPPYDSVLNRLVLWRDGKIGDVTRSSQFGAVLPIAMNNKGAVVGAAAMRPLRRSLCAFLWMDGKMTDLDALAGGPQTVLSQANSINDAGQIVGRGEKNGRGFAFLLTPKEVKTGAGTSGKHE